MVMSENYMSQNFTFLLNISLIHPSIYLSMPMLKGKQSVLGTLFLIKQFYNKAGPKTVYTN